MDLSGVLAIDDVDARGAEPLGVGVPFVAEWIEPCRDDQRRRLAGEILRAQRRGARVVTVGVRRQILRRVPLDAVARDDVALDELAMRCRVEREIDGGIDQHLARRHGHAGLRRELRHHRRQIPSGRVARDGDTRGIRAELGRVRAKPAIRGEAIVDGGRELVLGRQSIIDRNDDRAGTQREPRAQAVVRLEIALHPAAAVEVRDHRARRRTDTRGVVDPPGNRARRSGNGDVLDACEVGRRFVHQLYHRPELLP